MTGSIPLGKPGTIKPMAVLMSPDASKLFVSTGRGHQVFTIDTGHRQGLGSVEVGPRPWGIALSPDGEDALFREWPVQRHLRYRCRNEQCGSQSQSGRQPLGRDCSGPLGHDLPAQAVSILVIGLALCLTRRADAQPELWRVDPLHSSAQFSVRHMMISTVRGQFGGVKGTVLYDAKNPAASSVEVTIDCSTVNTGEAKRDADLKGPEFFDVKRYPVMKFKSTAVTAAGPGRLRVAGNLTINATVRPVTLDVDGPTAPIRDTQQREKIGVSAVAKISRKDFGILYNPVMETGGVAVSDEVSIILELELLRGQI